MTHDAGRRLVLRRLGQAGLVLGGSGVLAALGLLSPGRWRKSKAARLIPDRRVAPDTGKPPMVVARGGVIASRVRASVDAVGGIGRFVKPGQTVLVKPNMAWDRNPAQGANTNPEVVAEVVRLCREARASRVIVGDVPVHHAERTLASSGIAAAAREAGAVMAAPPGQGFARAALNGSVLDEWEVFEPALVVDRIVNVPVVKVHPLSRLTCGLKNWYGLLGGRRGLLHQWIHPSIADLASAFRPTLTVVDATRVMVRGGPQGGRLEDLIFVEAVAAGTDPVALDAWGATLVGLDPREIGHIALAQGRGLGSIDAGLSRREEIRVGA
jgi:uncharacterized protein (DUF362 family)